MVEENFGRKLSTSVVEVESSGVGDMLFAYIIRVYLKMKIGI